MIALSLSCPGIPQSSQKALPQWTQNFPWNLQSRNLKHISPEEPDYIMSPSPSWQLQLWVNPGLNMKPETPHFPPLTMWQAKLELSWPVRLEIWAASTVTNLARDQMTQWLKAVLQRALLRARCCRARLQARCSLCLAIIHRRNEMPAPSPQKKTL